MVKRKIALIGAGKLACSLLPALIKGKYHVDAVISRNLHSAELLANKFSIGYYSDSPEKIPPEINVFFLTVPDGEIKKVADSLSKLNRDFTNCICIHFSGVENISSLNSLQNKGCSTGSLHIIRPFPSKSVVDIKNSPASVEAGDEQAKLFLTQLCRKLKLKPHLISSDEKIFHHIAAVHSSNFLVGNLFNAFRLLMTKNSYPETILKNTTQSALDNVFSMSPAKALSGPVDRGDVYTIKKHLQAFDNKIKQVKDKRGFKLLRKNYILQSLLLLNVAEKKYGTLSKQHIEIKKILTRALKA